MNRISKYFSKELKERSLDKKAGMLKRYVGDIHNHCGISYGYGTIEHAIEFAKTQLDFFSVTGHFAWPDIADDSSMRIPEDVIAYHRKGFAKLRKEWPHYKECMKNAETDSFLPFSSYEFHSFRYGDYTVVCRSLDEDLPDEPAEGMRDDRLEKLIHGSKEQTERFLPIPHHIGYKQGYRGINYDAFNPEASPLIEIISMHGCAESSESPIRYMHTMGPRCSSNTYQNGLMRGIRFAVTGSTDHHNASPGSYGFGRTVLWAEDLGRDTVWNALRNGQTSAASGDPIEVMLFADGNMQGSAALKKKVNHIDAFVVGYDKLEKVELVQGDKVIWGRYCFDQDDSYDGAFSIMFGWGKKHAEASWDIKISAENGTINSVSPRFRGVDMVDPLDVPANADKYLPHLERNGNEISLHLVTDGNINAVTNSTQGLAIETEGSKDTRINVSIKASWAGQSVERQYSYTLSEIRSGNTSEYINGFVSPSFDIGPFRTRSEISACISEDFELESSLPVYLRAYQKNGDAVFSSPVFFDEEKA